MWMPMALKTLSQASQEKGGLAWIFPALFSVAIDDRAQPLSIYNYKMQKLL